MASAGMLRSRRHSLWLHLVCTCRLRQLLAPHVHVSKTTTGDGCFATCTVPRALMPHMACAAAAMSGVKPVLSAAAPPPPLRVTAFAAGALTTTRAPDFFSRFAAAGWPKVSAPASGVWP